MTTYAYPITLYEYTFDELKRMLEHACEEDEKEGYPSYNTQTGRPLSTFANILEIMKEAKESTKKNSGQHAPVITFTLTDYLFIPLENLLKEKCKFYKNNTGNNSFDPITGEPQHTYTSMLEAMRLAIKNMSLNSYSSFTHDERIVLWSPKNL